MEHWVHSEWGNGYQLSSRRRGVRRQGLCSLERGSEAFELEVMIMSILQQDSNYSDSSSELSFHKGGSDRNIVSTEQLPNNSEAKCVGKDITRIDALLPSHATKKRPQSSKSRLFDVDLRRDA
ncbi:hypothetical protein GLAREA_11548 [Glarea lozoyensis ATCC 20868]|uniref:Uncharacterized protein n=1 Tax=Glarea lozoyensis (strain ATCC 20868 / MF5171) TaxID=1116229 RepID=S3CEP5_GLAL2|nr:uncharacterized protein GLAREA_11548 [Glarea lozoyensis ATCC 20868]EPE24967.1 hypothetical protein GLAREA_11548 [Glarea lozoyensis ATCC 20868]